MLWEYPFPLITLLPFTMPSAVDLSLSLSLSLGMSVFLSVYLSLSLYVLYIDRVRQEWKAIRQILVRLVLCTVWQPGPENVLVR